ncbi:MULTISPECIES: (2Fe-2S)-binding protein [unclassified Streptomyces]|uniref:(2Fe-2S)-binding protein n=1 Tax=unclassified Streptomyces TaxID=2593676 RepID=UPI00070EC68B|nr:MULTISPECIES: (2Fe-2S)-binding protein [unclassified Streptomyces]KRD12300.1 ferric iron reductase [Streptomyces sp. Root264]
MDLDTELALLRPLGGFFALRTSPGSPGEHDRRLPTLAQAYARTHSPPSTGAAGRSGVEFHDDPLAFRVRNVTRALRAPEERVGASVAQQGLAARLWSVALGCAVLYGCVPDLAPGLLRWDPDAGAPDDLWLTRVRAGRPGDAAGVAETVLEGHLEPLSAALRARCPVAPGLLRGNAASALAATARLLGRWADGHSRPDVAVRTRDLTARLLAHPLLAGTGSLSGDAFRRRSCCLYYRVPGGGVCGDCCFTRPPRSSPRAASG